MSLGRLLSIVWLVFADHFALQLLRSGSVAVPKVEVIKSEVFRRVCPISGQKLWLTDADFVGAIQELLQIFSF